MAVLILAGDYDGLLVTAGLEALYKLNEESGPTAFDSSGSSNDATLAGAPVWLPQALQIDDGDSFGVGTPPAGLLSDAFTLCAVCKWTSGQNAPLLGWAAADFPGVYAGAPASSGRPSIRAGDTIVRYFELSSPVDLTDGEYHFLAFSAPGRGTADAASFLLRADGQDQDAFDTTATGAETAKTAFTAGDFAASAVGAAFELAFLSIHSRVLSATEKDQMRVYAQSFMPAPVASGAIQSETGSDLLTETGDPILVE